MMDEADFVDDGDVAKVTRRRRIVDLLVVIDTESLTRAYPEPSHNCDDPTLVGSDICNLIAPSVDAVYGVATANLGLFAYPSQDLRWQSVSMSGNSGQSVVIYGVERVNEDGEEASPASAFAYDRVVPMPILERGANTDPPSFSAVSSQVYYLQLKTHGEGDYRFNVYFYLTHQSDEDGKPVLSGYYLWQPAITLIPAEDRP